MAKATAKKTPAKSAKTKTASKAKKPKVSNKTIAAKTKKKSKTSVKKTTQKSFTLTDNQTGKSYELPVLDGSIGPSVIDIRKLYAETGHFTFDPSFTATGSCKSRLTYIDGEKGVLLHRGYSIEDLTKKASFMEVAHLLLYGDLPTKKQRAEFEHNITYHTMVHEQIHYFYRGFRRDAHPMAVMCGVVGALSAFYHDS